MKRVLALLLVLSVMLSVLVLHVNAITESKITPKLAEKLNEMKDDEKIEVWIEASFNYFDEEKLEQICEEECGFSRDQIETMEQADLWRRTWNQAVNNALYEAVVDIFEKMDIKEADITGTWQYDNVYGWPSRFSLTKAKIFKVADVKEITSIDIYTDQDQEPDWPIEPPEPNTRYLDKLYEQYDQLPKYEDLPKYDEVFYHTDETGEIDWALVYVFECLGIPDVSVERVVGGREIYLPSPEYPFTIRYAVYDVKEDHFYDLVDYDLLKPTDVFERYDGLYEVWQTLDLSEMSLEMICGDANGDRDVDIIDTTWIQRYLVSLVSKYDISETAADVDGDGDVTIIDATRIQRVLVGLCNLDGTPC